MKPLADVRVIAVEQYGAGPFATLQLADLGAEVIKIEDPAAGGDVGRVVPPYTSQNSSLFFESFNRNKESLYLDITTKAGRRILEDLVSCSDVLFANVRGDVPTSLKLRFDDLKHCNPRIVCCFLTGYGMSGSNSTQGAYDYLIQGLAGWMDLTGEPDGPPVRTGLSLVDYCAGYVAAISILSGLHLANVSGSGLELDVSLFDTAISLLTYPATWHLTAGHTVTRTSNSAHPSLVPFQNFQTADGWIVVACPKEKFWSRLVSAIGLPELVSNQRFSSFDDRERSKVELIALLEQRFIENTSKYWLEALTEAGVPCGPIENLADALANPLVQERNLILEIPTDELGTVRQVASAVRTAVGNNFDSGDRPAPMRNGSFDYVMKDLLGYAEREIGEMRGGGAFG